MASEESLRTGDGKSDSGPLMLACLFGCAAVLVRLLSPGQPDPGDGIAHYQIARYAWSHHHLLFDAWAKPVYTLLASPFAQIGVWGPAVLCVCCGIASVLLIIRRMENVDPGWHWMVPSLVFLSPQYAFTTMAGLTEPVFGLLALAGAVALISERYVAAMLLASFLPFTRPEYVVALPVMIGYTLLMRRWRAIPWVLTGTVVGVISAWLLLKDPWSVLFHDPYAGVDVYGTGPLTHFIERMDEVIGVPFTVLSIIALLITPFIVRKDRPSRARHVRVLALTFVPSIGILLVHSYAWWKGGHGSLGLLRVLATAVPLWTYYVVYMLGSGWRLWVGKNRISDAVLSSLVAGVIMTGVPGLIDTLLLPFYRDPVQRSQAIASDRVRSILVPGAHVYSIDPFMIALCELDPWDSTRTRSMFGLHRLRQPPMMKDDIVIWDAHFCPNEGGIPLDSLKAFANLQLVETIAPEERPMMLGGLPYEIDVFRCTGAPLQVRLDTVLDVSAKRSFAQCERIDTLPSDGSAFALRLSSTEFPLEFKSLWFGKEGAGELLVQCETIGTQAAPDKLLFVLAESQGDKQVRYETIDLGKGPIEWRLQMPTGADAPKNKLYIWNRTGVPVALKRLLVTARYRVPY